MITEGPKVPGQEPKETHGPAKHEKAEEEEPVPAKMQGEDQRSLGKAEGAREMLEGVTTEDNKETGGTTEEIGGTREETEGTREEAGVDKVVTEGDAQAMMAGDGRKSTGGDIMRRTGGDG